MNNDSSPVYTRYHWAKSDRQDHGRIHLLEHHLADVGACFEALLEQPIIRQRLAQSGGLDDLDMATAARLCVFAALHDIGKVNVGFQARIWRREDLPPGERSLPRRAGHALDMTPVLTQEDRKTADWFFDALGWWWDAIDSWDDRGGETVCALLVATLSHHGLPLQLEGGYSANPLVWQPFGQLDPKQFVEQIGRLVRGWFPAAFSDDAPPLPSAPTFQHMFLGLCNWADWIGSNEQWFPYADTPQDSYFERARMQAKTAINSIGLDLSPQRSSFQDVPGFGDMFDIPGAPTPNAIQQAAALNTPLAKPLIIIESETGSGKTEAALWRFARMYEAGLVDGLYFALPTRAAAVQIHGRVKRFIANLFPAEHRPPVVLAVPGYLPGDDAGSIEMPQYNPWWEDHHDTERPWATEGPKRYLAAQIAVGTVDQAMLGALQVKNAHMRTTCLARNLLVVDEVHASDTYMRVVMEALLDAHAGAGGYALLMSATLGSVARHRWLDHGNGTLGEAPSLEQAIKAPYPAVSTRGPVGDSLAPAGENNQDKMVNLQASPSMRDFPDVARRALEAARDGAKVLVVRNTVDYAISTQQALVDLAGPGDAGLLFDVAGIPTLHHGRFAAVDRQLLDAKVEALLGRGRAPGGRIVVGTQTLEQSLDIDADLLITDLCPVDVLLQRIGRLHRHRNNDANRPAGYTKPRCVVLSPDGDDLSPFLNGGTEANGLGPHGGVYEDLRTLEATRRLMAEHSEWRIPEMNRYLVEQATHPEALEAIVRELGEDWQAHGLRIDGADIGDGLTARGVTIRRDKSFFTDNRDVAFISSDENIRTRLGDDRIDIAFDPQPSSPFDAALRVERLAMSARWLRGVELPDSVTPLPTDGGFAFSVGDRRFTYDSLGLRRD